MRIPFDSVVLSSVAAELTNFVGSFVQGIRQPDDFTAVLNLYISGGEGRAGAEASLLLCCDPSFARVHFVTRRPANSPEPPSFCAALRARIDGGRLISAEQIAGDRVLLLEFESGKGNHWLVAELMGKHSNLILVDDTRKIVSACKWITGDRSLRPVRSGIPYAWPPTLDSSQVDEASPKTPSQWKEFGASHSDKISPFFRSLMASKDRWDDRWSPGLSPENGAYPISLEGTALQWLPRESISIALEQHYSRWIVQHEIESARSSLIGQLNRVLLARETALADLKQTKVAGLSATKWQQVGELILAFGFAPQADPSKIEAFDYDGKQISITINPDLTVQKNADAYFEKAKKAKARAGFLVEQIERLEADRFQVEQALAQATAATRLVELNDLKQAAAAKRWLFEQRLPQAREDRPYQGFRVREIHGPGGVRILFGENAESNDYLTLNVARPNDYWLHVRGSTSAHVVIMTNNHPEKINREQLEYAAKIAVKNSTSKHSGFVPVDYTLKRYVRRPRGAAKGAAIYTHEKTLHVEG